MDFREELLLVMEQKEHWSDPYFFGNNGHTSPIATRDGLLFHLRQEYIAYVNDFSNNLKRILLKNPPYDVRKSLLDNILEEETGTISGYKRSHPEMFLDMPEGFGYSREKFEKIIILEESLAYRSRLEIVTTHFSWIEALAVMTIFVEGNYNERAELNNSRQLGDLEIKEEVRNHRFVKVYGLQWKYLDLKRAHLKVEHEHRTTSWRNVMNYTKTENEKRKVLDSVKKSLESWINYREGVAREVGLQKYDFVTA